VKSVPSWASTIVLILALLAAEPLRASTVLTGRSEVSIQLQKEAGSASPYMATLQVA